MVRVTYVEKTCFRGCNEFSYFDVKINKEAWQLNAFKYRINKRRLLTKILLRYYVVVVVVVVEDLGFTKLLTCLVINVAFYSQREKADKFCSEALISARKSTTRDPRIYFPSQGSHTQNFYALKKNPSTPAGFEPANLESSGEYDNHVTTGVDPIL